VGRRVSFGSWSYDLDLRAGAGAVYLCPLAAVSLFPPPPRRDFIVQRYVELKKAHPNLPILIRECSEVQPKLWARYGEYWSPEVRGPGCRIRDGEMKGPPNVLGKRG
jgi:hypothetical protein